MKKLSTVHAHAAKLILGLAVIAGTQTLAHADAVSIAINAASNGLVSQQSGGMWTGTGADGYNGTILAGLVNAYNNTGTVQYRTAAETGATALFTDVNAHHAGIYVGDELYALTQVAGLQVAPAASTWHSEAQTFFGTTVPNGYGSTSGYINALVTDPTYAGDKTQPTIYLSYLTLAAYAVDAQNGHSTNFGATYRTELINTLGKVSDENQAFPVGALGAAVWALAQTGNGLDSTPITGPASGQNVFGGHVLSDLPGMLDSRFDPLTHTFDWLLTDNSYNGYTEDTAFGILGLDAVDDATHTGTYAAHVAAARLALTAAVDSGTGTTYDSALTPSFAADVFAGRTLQALEAPEPASAALLLLGTAGLLARRRKAAH